jgi:bile acid:Na+ symporter, BASS family
VTALFDLMIRISQLVLPVFIYCTMANIGMSQDPRRIVKYWGEWPFYLKMLAANFLAAPSIMWLLLHIWSLPLDQKAGLAVFSLCAGAPFLIKLTATSKHDLALGAATMLLLVLATIVMVPLVLPILIPELSVDGPGLAWTLGRQLLLPILLGGLLARFAPHLNHRLQPWVARVGNIALNVVLVSTFLGYLQDIPGIVRSGALVLGLIFILAAFAAGYVAGWGNDALEDIGGLATAQRNTAAAMLIGVSSFSDPIVFVLITLVNALGIALLIGIARMLTGDNVKVGVL